MSRPLRVGDRVTATGTVCGVGMETFSVRFDSDGVLKHRLGFPAAALTLMEPAEPPVGSVVVKDGVAYTRWFSNGRGDWESAEAHGSRSWDDINDGVILFTPGSPE